jgi:telomere-associated protein RIF1
MKDLLDNGMKIQAIQAWGWFIRMLGSHALKNKHLLFKRTFTDPDPQIQIATQVPYISYCIIPSMIHSGELCVGCNSIQILSEIHKVA